MFVMSQNTFSGIVSYDSYAWTPPALAPKPGPRRVAMIFGFCLGLVASVVIELAVRAVVPTSRNVATKTSTAAAGGPGRRARPSPRHHTAARLDRYAEHVSSGLEDEAPVPPQTAARRSAPKPRPVSSPVQAPTTTATPDATALLDDGLQP
jgi:hypothetical protein